MKDAIIIGSGAGGGPLALELTRAGYNVLVFEKGPRHQREDYDHQTGIEPRGFVPSLDDDPHTVVTRKTTTPLLTNLGWIASCVGGGTVHMGAYFYRFHADDFRMHSRFGDYEEIVDWPFGYDELEPYYTRAEWEVGVSGLGGSNPFEGKRSKDYPLPPLDAHPIAPQVEKACQDRGWHPFPTPRAINSRPYQGRPACAECDLCASYGCPVGARGTSQEALLARAEATGRCEVRTGAMVKEILVDREGRATGCVYIDAEGEEHEERAHIVCICCSAIESARLLLLSRSARFPNGIGNANGLVGRHLQFHGVSMGSAMLRSGHPQEILEDDFPFLGRSVMDPYFLPEGVSDLAKGGLLRFGRASQTAQGYAPVEFRQIGAEAPPPTPRSERSDVQAPDGLPLYFEVFHDFLPNRHTWMELDDQVRDRWGLPVARIHLDLPGHHRRAGVWVMQQAFQILDDIGCEDLAPADIGGTSAYLVHGTCRAGTDPETSVLDSNCRVHGVSNLFVVDGSFMPTSGGSPPTLTILANSFRVADHLVTHWDSI